MKFNLEQGNYSTNTHTPHIHLQPHPSKPTATHTPINTHAHTLIHIKPTPPSTPSLRYLLVHSTCHDLHTATTLVLLRYTHPVDLHVIRHPHPRHPHPHPHWGTYWSTAHVMTCTQLPLLFSWGTPILLISMWSGTHIRSVIGALWLNSILDTAQ